MRVSRGKLKACCSISGLGTQQEVSHRPCVGPPPCIALEDSWTWAVPRRSQAPAAGGWGISCLSCWWSGGNSWPPGARYLNCAACRVALRRFAMRLSSPPGFERSGNITSEWNLMPASWLPVSCRLDAEGMVLTERPLSESSAFPGRPL